MISNCTQETWLKIYLNQRVTHLLWNVGLSVRLLSALKVPRKTWREFSDRPATVNHGRIFLVVNFASFFAVQPILQLQRNPLFTLSFLLPTLFWRKIRGLRGRQLNLFVLFWIWKLAERRSVKNWLLNAAWTTGEIGVKPNFGRLFCVLVLS